MSLYEFHEAANLFPLLAGEEFDALVADIRAHGQLEPIVLYDNMILDGRNRYLACQQLGIEPKVSIYRGTLSPVEFVISRNLHRRHLTASQRAVLALDVLPQLEAEAKQRQGTRTDLVETIPPSSIKSRDQAAQLTAVNPHYVSDAKAIQQKAPQLLEQVRAGELTIPEAKREIRKLEFNIRCKARMNGAADIPIPVGKYRCIEADPPWALDACEGKSAIAHYNVMDLDAIKALGVKVLERAADDCHLWLWAINPMLPEALDVMKAWGFEYKSCLTWVKSNGFGTGHYLRGATEHCLLGVRGSLKCLRNDQRTYFEAPRTDHSRKPEIFYELIETLSPSPRLRLFARSQRYGWDSWGDQV